MVYGPLISIYEKNRTNLILKRKKFNTDICLNDTDLLVGFMPCGAANCIVDSAIENNDDFIVALCEGESHGDIFDYFEDEEEWLHSIIYTASDGARRNNMGTLIKEKSLKKYNDYYLVIYNKRK